MSKRYGHLKQYEKEILSLKEQGVTLKGIGDKLGFSKEQIKDFLKRYRRNQARIDAGILPKTKGRPRKKDSQLPPSVQKSGKLSQLQYELSRKDVKIRQLEMENELMRDFLSLTGRK